MSAIQDSCALNLNQLTQAVFQVIELLLTPVAPARVGCSAEGLAELKADGRVGACADPTTINSTTPLHSKLLPLNISRTIFKSPAVQPCVTE